MLLTNLNSWKAFYVLKRLALSIKSLLKLKEISVTVQDQTMPEIPEF